MGRRRGAFPRDVAVDVKRQQKDTDLKDVGSCASVMRRVRVGRRRGNIDYFLDVLLKMSYVVEK
jgi:hypothetical protein